jgi:hypothetical protein
MRNSKENNDSEATKPAVADACSAEHTTMGIIIVRCLRVCRRRSTIDTMRPKTHWYSNIDEDYLSGVKNEDKGINPSWKFHQDVHRYVSFTRSCHARMYLRI